MDIRLWAILPVATDVRPEVAFAFARGSQVGLQMVRGKRLGRCGVCRHPNYNGEARFPEPVELRRYVIGRDGLTLCERCRARLREVLED